MRIPDEQPEEERKESEKEGAEKGLYITDKSRRLPSRRATSRRGGHDERTGYQMKEVAQRMKGLRK